MTVRKYAEILAGALMVRILQPWRENVGKRLVKIIRNN
jgi:predicted AAA+ superfamily ATPase